MSALIERIKLHEGYRSKPYRDTVGKVTIGWGRNLDDNGIRKEEAEIMLRHDVMIAQDAASQFTWYRKLDEQRKGVVVEMIFNLGLPRFLEFKKMIQALRDDDYDEAAAQMLNSKWSMQVGMRALTLASIMKDG